MRATIPAVAYVRMSSSKQEASPQQQRDEIETLAKGKYRIIRWYTDEGISGAESEKRAGFQRLIHDATNLNDFDAILCWDQDRFSRFEPMEANHYWHILSQVGVKIVTVAQGELDFSDLGGWLTASVTQYGKAQYLRDLSRNVGRGLRKQRENGVWLGSTPFGYDKKDGKLILGKPEDVALVRRIFETRTRGYAIRAIARQLNQEGIPTPRGSHWVYTSVKHILDREAYIGNTAASQRSKAKFESAIPRGQCVKGTHEPIISREVWDKVRNFPTQTIKAHDRSRDSSSLAGLVRCGKCGRNMYQHNTQTGYRYFYCPLSVHGDCGRNSTDSGKLEAVVYAKIRERVLGHNFERLTEKIQEHLDQIPGPPDHGNEISRLDRQIKQGYQRILAVDESLVLGLEQQVLELKERRDCLASQQVDRPPLPSARDVANDVWELDRILRESPPVEARATLQQFVESIQLEHAEQGSSKKRRRYVLLGGSINLRFQEGPRHPILP